MRTHVQQAADVLREDGLGSLLADTAAYLRREGSRAYAARRYDPDAPECLVMDEDWDTLVILDACRYDQFQRLADLPGDLSARASLGSCTPEFLAANFAEAAYHDTVYVTANPMYRAAGVGDAFHDVVDVWESDWDDGNQTVRPEEMVAATLDARERYPNKRVVSHFVQPHYPFLGGAGADVAGQTGDSLSGIEWISRRTEEDAMDDRATPWDLLDEGRLDEESVREAYDENLRVALPHVETLVESLSEKAVVTSDHGNLVGDRIAPFGGPVYGHPPKTPADGLRKVPWLVVEGSERITPRAEPPVGAADEAGDVVSDRLADLGYA